MNRIRAYLMTGAWIVFATLISFSSAHAQKQGAKPSISDLMVRKVNLRADDIDIRLAAKQLFEQVGANYVIDKSVQGTVTLSLKHVPFRTALVSVLKSSGFTYAIENGVFRIVRIRDDEAGFSGRPYPPPGTPLVMQVNYISSTVAANSIRSMPGFRPEDGVTIKSLPDSNRLIVITQTTEQFREVKDALLLMDWQSQQVEIKAELVLTLAGRGNRRPFTVFASTGRTLSNQPVTLNTVTNGKSAPPDQIALQDGISHLRLTPRINGDDTVTLDADWKAALTWRVRGEAKPRQMQKTFHGAITLMQSDTKALASTVMRLDSAHEAELRLFLTPRIWKTERNDYSAIRDVNTAIVLDFANPSGIGGEKLAAFATKTIADELAHSTCFEVLKRDEVQLAVRGFHIQPPFSPVEITRIADQLGANVVVTGEITFVRPAQGRDPKTFSVGLGVRLQDAYHGDVLNRTTEVAEAQAKPGQTDENAIIENAIYKAGRQVVRRIVARQVPDATILATRVDEANAGFVEIDRGFRDGIHVGLEMAVYRGRQRVGKIKVVRVQATSAEGRVRETTFAIRPEDKARVILPTLADTAF